jgi:hypothetical protein
MLGLLYGRQLVDAAALQPTRNPFFEAGVERTAA